MIRGPIASEHLQHIQKISGKSINKTRMSTKCGSYRFTVTGRRGKTSGLANEQGLEAQNRNHRSGHLLALCALIDNR